MQELAGRLAALDPDAGDELRVIGYFDALIRGCAGTEALVKGAAVLSGAIAGATWPGGALRMSPDGQRLPPSASDGWPACDADDARVWIERHGAAHANDAMVLERCALGLALVRVRHRTRAFGPIAVLLDADREESERAATAERVGIGPRVRVAATRPEETLPVPSVVLPGPDGSMRVGLLGPSTGPLTGSVGLGRWGPATGLPDSWSTLRGSLWPGASRSTPKTSAGCSTRPWSSRPDGRRTRTSSPSRASTPGLSRSWTRLWPRTACAPQPPPSACTTRVSPLAATGSRSRSASIRRRPSAGHGPPSPGWLSSFGPAERAGGG